jgi:RNA polymerase sigma-70 factor (ECF subfamily)
MLRDPPAADDALQDVWLAVSRALPRLADPAAFRAWAYRIARDRAARELRTRRPAEVPLDADGPADARADTDGFTAEDAACVHAALDELAAEHREVLVLRYVEDMTYDEIARVSGCQVGTVRSRLHYAKRALRGVLERTDRRD